MCVSKLEPCVLLGLDWVEPMMQFSLHVTCSCIRTFSFSFLVLSIDGAFLFFSFSPSLSLSLSLSLLDSLGMAPKCKTTLSWNPLHSGASSSDPTPLHVKFHDENAYQHFSENFSKRGIHSERHVILLDFSSTTLTIIIHSRGWESLCKIPVSCPSMIIQEFYFNLHSLIVLCLSLLLMFEVHV